MRYQPSQAGSKQSFWNSTLTGCGVNVRTKVENGQHIGNSKPDSRLCKISARTDPDGICRSISICSTAVNLYDTCLRPNPYTTSNGSKSLEASTFVLLSLLSFCVSLLGLRCSRNLSGQKDRGLAKVLGSFIIPLESPELAGRIVSDNDTYQTFAKTSEPLGIVHSP